MGGASGAWIAHSSVVPSPLIVTAPVESAFAVAGAAVGALWVTLSVRRRARALRIEFHRPLRDVVDHVPQQIPGGSLLGKLR
jgi:hypothetical protein